MVLRQSSLVAGILLFLHTCVRKNSIALASNSDFSVGWPPLFSCSSLMIASTLCSTIVIIWRCVKHGSKNGFLPLFAVMNVSYDLIYSLGSGSLNSFLRI